MNTTTAHLSTSAAARQLAGSEAHARRVEDEWRERDVALFAVGPIWDAVKIPAELVHAVAVGDELKLVRAMLVRLGIMGPVVLDRGTCYALVPPGTAGRWDAAAECITTTAREAHYMGVPSPGRREGPWAHWVIEPDGESLCSPAAVRALVEAGAELTAQAGSEADQ
jgi:hypothetical protein